jgi:hypothetical protein
VCVEDIYEDKKLALLPTLERASHAWLEVFIDVNILARATLALCVYESLKMCENLFELERGGIIGKFAACTSDFNWRY